MQVTQLYSNDFNSFEERINNHWTIDAGMIEDDVLILSVNGQVTHGDRLQYRMLKDCNTINILTTFITGLTPPKVEGKLLANAKYNEANIIVSIPFISENSLKDFSLHFVWVDLGWYTVDTIKNYYEGVDTIKLTLKDSNIFKTDKYLTTKSNSWTTQGMSEGLDRAVQYCKDTQKI